MFSIIKQKNKVIHELLASFIVAFFESKEKTNK